MSTINYVINKEKRTVVCIMRNAEEDACGPVEKYLDSKGLSFDWATYKKLLLPESIVGVAKCNPNDEWDEEFGKRLARKRCSDKYEAIKLEKLRKFWNEIISLAHLVYDKLIIPI